MRGNKHLQWMLWSLIPLLAIGAGYYLVTGDFPGGIIAGYLGVGLGVGLVKRYAGRREGDKDEDDFW
ncbi:hypothetical protein ACH9EU_08480 [Kocuria sp. M1R5S2]|uniref:hypothetical protein n=1 Tax=Kocuria rhizosphaerae TaxID=3376285 RepID=UPI00378BC12B